jgi:sarcosine oxidase subunit gamma
MATSLDPTDFKRRSFLYRKLRDAGARFGELAGGAVALDYGDPTKEAETARRMGLADLSVLPRTGFKGAGTAEWLAAQGVVLPEESNQAARQADGALAARLAPRELHILGDLEGSGALIERLESAWAAEPLPPQSPRGYPVPRRETHAWFLVTGASAAAMFAKICGVDLRPDRFADGRIAQTSVARANAVVIRDDRHGTLAYHLLVDSASADFFWPAVLDAMAEFEGAPVGLGAVQGLAGA